MGRCLCIALLALSVLRASAQDDSGPTYEVTKSYILSHVSAARYKETVGGSPPGWPVDVDYALSIPPLGETLLSLTYDDHDVIEEDKNLHRVAVAGCVHTTISIDVRYVDQVIAGDGFITLKSTAGRQIVRETVKYCNDEVSSATRDYAAIDLKDDEPEMTVRVAKAFNHLVELLQVARRPAGDPNDPFK